MDPATRTVSCRSLDGAAFSVQYDKLAICTGSQGSTFGIPGVHQHAHFLRDVKQAEAIRQRLIENLALAGIPGGWPQRSNGVCTAAAGVVLR